MLERRDFLYTFSSGTSSYCFSGCTGKIVEYDSFVAENMQKIENNQDVDSEFMEVLYGNFNENEILNHEYKPSPIKTLNVFTTTDCNLRCTYCYHSKNELPAGKYMDTGTFERAMDWIDDHIGFYSETQICFFGGEPLLNSTFIKEAMDFLKEFGKSKGLKFIYSCTTNGTLINDSIKQLIVDSGMHVSVSYDGPVEQHDKYRIFANGRGSHDCTISGLHKLAETMTPSIRMKKHTLNFAMRQAQESRQNFVMRCSG